jgi:hypothetical protein
MNEVEVVGGGEPTVSGVVTAVGLGIVIATAPAWGAVAALVALAAVGIKAIE